MVSPQAINKEASIEEGGRVSIIALGYYVLCDTSIINCNLILMGFVRIEDVGLT